MQTKGLPRGIYALAGTTAATRCSQDQNANIARDGTISSKTTQMSEFPNMDPALKEALETLHDLRQFCTINALSWRRGATLGSSNPMWHRVDEILRRYGVTANLEPGTRGYKRYDKRYTVV